MYHLWTTPKQKQLWPSLLLCRLFTTYSTDIIFMSCLLKNDSCNLSTSFLWFWMLNYFSGPSPKKWIVMRPPRNSFFKLCSCIFCIAYSLGDLNEHRPPSSVNQGTPSHLSIGTSSIYTTGTWTEGTPSYTESSMSGGSLGRASADPGQSHQSWVCIVVHVYQLLFSNPLNPLCFFVLYAHRLKNRHTQHCWGLFLSARISAHF